MALLIGIILTIGVGYFLANTPVKPIHVEISESKIDTATTSDSCLVSGTVSDPNARVYVVIRPFMTKDYWVQEPATVDGTGNWQLNAHCGEAIVGAGESFEIIALATHENFIVTWLTGNWLTPGNSIKELPINSNRSNIVNVKRSP